jgi:hypothetical protein
MSIGKFVVVLPFLEMVLDPLQHKVHIFTEYHSVCPLVGIGTLPVSHPLSRQRMCPSPRYQKGGGAHSPAGDGLGESQ